MSDELTPTEYLVMEVLAARYRLGELRWPFQPAVRPALRRLEARGLIGWKSDIAPNAYAAWLTDEGVEAWRLDNPWLSTPVDRFIEALGADSVEAVPPEVVSGGPMALVAWWGQRRERGS